MCFDVVEKLDGELASVMCDVQHAAAFVYDELEPDVQVHGALFARACDLLILDTDDAERIDWDVVEPEYFVSVLVHAHMLPEFVLQHYFAFENFFEQVVVCALHAVFVVIVLHTVVFSRNSNHSFARKLLQYRRQ